MAPIEQISDFNWSIAVLYHDSTAELFIECHGRSQISLDGSVLFCAAETMSPPLGKFNCRKVSFVLHKDFALNQPPIFIYARITCGRNFVKKR
jgi:hypothetical protein